MIRLFHYNKNIAQLYKDENEVVLHYNENVELHQSISLTLPATKRTHISWYRLHPFFEMYLPEGYLFELLKNFVMKEYGRVDDFLLFRVLCSNIEARITYKSDVVKDLFLPVDLEDVMVNDTPDLFHNLLQRFLRKNAISGIHPKTLMVAKEQFEAKEYILKTWGEEFPNLAENEYFSLKAVAYSGVPTANVRLSKHKRFLVVEKFTRAEDGWLGFEEALVLLGKHRDAKYSGSYEQVAKVILGFSTQKREDGLNFYKLVVMNYLLKNGDAHLKNFGLLYSDDYSNRWCAPAYDVVTTPVYIFHDKPALTLFGKKVWYGKDALVEFGQKECFLKKSEALKVYDECVAALERCLDELKAYVDKTREFVEIGKRMIDIWEFSLQNKEEDVKELPCEIAFAWQKDKKT